MGAEENAAFRAVQSIADDIEELRRFLEVCQQVFTYSLECEKSARWVGKWLYEGKVQLTADKLKKADEWRREMMQIDGVTSQVRQLVEADHAYLYDLVIVRLWTSIESGLNDLCIALL